MNQLTEFLVDGILNEDKQEVIGIYAGGFKPPTAGHFQVVEEALKQYPEIDKLIVLVGSGVRDGIEQAESILVWEIYQNYLPMKVEIQPTTKPPIGAVYSYAGNNPDDTIYWILGARDGKDEDLSDIAQRTAAIDKAEDKYNNVKVKVITTPNKDMSGTNARKALQDGDQKTFFRFVPTQVEEKEEIFNILRPAVTETSNPNDGKAAPFGSGYDEVKEQVDFKSLESQLDNMFAELDIDVAFTNHFKERVLERGLTEEDILELANKIIDQYPDELDFLDKDQNIVMSHLSRLVDIAAVNTGYGDDYLKDLVFKTAFKRKDKSEPEFRTNKSSPRLAVKEKKDPKKGTGKKPKGSGRRLYTDEDPKDTVGVKFSSRQDIIDTLNKKSFKAKSHARQSQIINLIHQRVRAAYNRAKDLDVKKRLKTALDYAEQRKEASKAKTQRLKKQKINEHSMGDSIDLLPYLAKLTQHMIDKGYKIEPLPGLELIDDDVTNAEDFFGKTAYYQPDTQTIVLYTHGRHPKDIARSFAHEMIHHIQNLEGRLGNITTTNTQEDDHLNKIEAEANLKGTMTFRNWTDSLQEGFDKKLGKDPFGLNQFARELMAEGAYDSLVTQLTNATIKKWVADSKKKPLPKKSFVDIDVDDVDGKGRPIEFNYVGQVEFDKKIDGYEVDGTSNSGEDEGKIIFVASLFKINPKILPQAWSKISADVSDVIRHEIEHITQAGDNTRSGKYMDDDIQIRDMINKLKILPRSDYYKLEKEVDAMLQGLYLKAKKTRKPFKDVIKNYLDIAPGIDTKEDKETILNLWRSRRKALSLPVFENEEKVMDYRIFLDMDGVLVDFDQQFKDLTGMMPREFESKYSTEEFWEKIDSAGVGFWRGMKWMPGGEALYNRAAQHDHFLLSSPSRSEISKIGKRLWRRDKTPNTKLYLARSYNKRKFAAPNHILIDDREDNIQQWRDAGGIGILYKSSDQVNTELDKLGL